MDKYLIAVYDAEDYKCFLIYESTISPQLNTQLHFPHLGLYNVKKIVYHVSDDHSKPVRQIEVDGKPCKKAGRKWGRYENR